MRMSPRIKTMPTIKTTQKIKRNQKMNITGSKDLTVLGSQYFQLCQVPESSFQELNNGIGRASACRNASNIKIRFEMVEIWPKTL